MIESLARRRDVMAQKFIAFLKLMIRFIEVAKLTLIYKARN